MGARWDSPEGLYHHVSCLTGAGEDDEGRERCQGEHAAMPPGLGADLFWGKSTAMRQLLQAARHR